MNTKRAAQLTGIPERLLSMNDMRDAIRLEVTMNRYVATITRLNGVSFEIHINTHSLEQATRIARDLLRDGETLVVESCHE